MTVRNQSINLPIMSGGPLAANSDTDEVLFVYSNSSGADSFGSVNTGVALFSTLPASTDTYDIASSAADGSSARIDRPGIYFAYWNGNAAEPSASFNVGITLDGAVLTAAFAYDTAGMRAFATIPVTAGPVFPDFTLAAIFVIDAATASSDTQGFARAMFESGDGDALNDAYFRITRIATFEG